MKTFLKWASWATTLLVPALLIAAVTHLTNAPGWVTMGAGAIWGFIAPSPPTRKP